MPSARRVLVIMAHPALQKSRVNVRLAAAARSVEGVTFHDLYELYPDYYIDVLREQSVLEAHDVVVFQHPFYWYSCPALLKEWIDLVLEFGFAYGPNGDRLRGKWLLSAITTGASEEAYSATGTNRFTINQLLAPFDQTARLCGMKWLPPFVVHSALKYDHPQSLAGVERAYAATLRHLLDPDFVLEQLEGRSRIMDIATPALGETFG